MLCYVTTCVMSQDFCVMLQHSVLCYNMLCDVTCCVMLQHVALCYMLCYVAECEHLIRRMLVLDPRRRYTMSQIRQHKWISAASSSSSSAALASSLQKDEARGCGGMTSPTTLSSGSVRTVEYDEQILRLMNTLGIEQTKTLEVFTYCLL